MAASGGMQRLRLLPAPEPRRAAAIGDVTGRQVILRGVNVNQLIDYYLRDPAVPATQPLTDDDFAQMAAMGFNVVRLGMSWSRLEPTPRRVRRGLPRPDPRGGGVGARRTASTPCSTCTRTPGATRWPRPTEQCGGGTTPTTGWDGAPAWATITDGTLHCQFLARDLAPAVATAFGNFYTDRDGIQTRTRPRPGRSSPRAFADEPAVAGYDLLNEPGIGANPPISSGLLLGRYYDAAITAIRDAETAGRRLPPPGLLRAERAVVGPRVRRRPRRPGFTDDTQLVFAPHPYSESITMDQSFGLTIASIERNLTRVRARAAASYGAALWAGRVGLVRRPGGGRREGATASWPRRTGSASAARSGCGGRAAARRRPGRDATTLRQPRRRRLRDRRAARRRRRASRRRCPAPTRGRSRAGSTRSSSGPGGRDLDVRRDGRPGRRELPHRRLGPGRRASRGHTTGVDDVDVDEVPGGWRITGCAAGSYRIAVTR